MGKVGHPIDESACTKWGVSEDHLCELCGVKGTMADILSGSYQWCHDRVLSKVADISD